MRKHRAFFLLLALFSAQACLAATRHYYIAAEDVTWDFAPSGMDLLHGRAIPPPWGRQTRWEKTRYIEYTDSTFSVRKPQPQWLGILGPIIRAEVGDTVIVDFFNRSRTWHSIHPHGLRYDKANEGSLYIPFDAGARVPPGGHFTYHWLADESSGPREEGPSSIVWSYHGHTDEATETNAGLVGPIIVTAKGKAKPDGSPQDVDREFVAWFMIFDQLSGKDSGLFHAINGYIFGNLPGLIMKKGDRVRWYLLAMGNEKDLHTPHWHGKVVQYGHRNTDVVELLPGSMATVDMIADNPGTWLFHCHVSDHMEAGMMATYTIYEPQHCSGPVQFLSADFWEPGKFHLTVKNVGSKPIKSIIVSYDHLLSAQTRRRPFQNEWSWNTPIKPGQAQTFEMPGLLPNYAQQVYGYILFPKTVTFDDGTTWQPKSEDECFEVSWRDKEHPPLVVLPPLQIELNQD
ncbi:MAG TPA: multicopper oxidase domain-containing protein [Terriglobales bacterium]|nr:multicopper oxidase domain-containing protein [Terriglobales bacterium]